MIDFLGYIGALFIGLILGLTGGGGSILTVPVLVYIMGLNPVIASAYSLFIVGVTSTFGTILNLKKGVVVLKTGLLFAAPSLIAVYLTRKFIVPAIPEILMQNSYFVLTKNTFLMVLFASVMLLASYSMLRSPKKADVTFKTKEHNIFLIVLQIFSVGILIGLIGAGGGFLFIPALFYFAKLPVKKAIGTSLLIISINSLIGFSGDVGNMQVDWFFLFRFSFIAIIGIFTGIFLSKFFHENNLKKMFGWFVLLMAIFILTKELVFN